MIGQTLHTIPKLLSRIPHLSLLLVLILFTGLTVYNSVILPIGEADDETDHYQYLRFVARSGHPPLTGTERQEAGFKGGLAPLYYWLTAWPIALIGEDARPDIRRVDARPERHLPTDGLGINHVLHTLDEQWPGQGHPLAWHIIRFFSLPMGWVTIVASYALARRLTPESTILPISTAAFIAFLPRFVISSAVINDDNLVFALTAVLLLVQINILQRDRPPTGKVMGVFGGLFGLSLVTKYFSLILVPEILLTLFIAGRKVTRPKIAGARPTGDLNYRPHPLRPRYYLSRTTGHAARSPDRQYYRSLLVFLAALFLTAGPWFIFITLRFNRIDELGFIPGLAAALGEPQITEGLVSLLSGQSIRPLATTYPLPAWLGLLYRSFWFEYGWMNIFAPAWIYVLFTIFSLIVLMGLVDKIRLKYAVLQAEVAEINHFTKALKTVTGLVRSISLTTWLLTLHLILFLSVLIVRYILSATIDTGQGRHLYPALPVIALLTALGLNHFGLWLLRLRSKLVSGLSTEQTLEPATTFSPGLGWRKPIAHFLPIVSYLLPVTCYLLPAAILLLPSVTIPPEPVKNSSFIIHHSPFILPNYPTIPASAIPIVLPPDRRQSIEFDSRLWLVGLAADDTASAGEPLPVTLYWHAEKEAGRDYLLSLCLQDNEARPAACWRGHVTDGRYPARAWESGDTIVDTIFIPIPTCYRLEGNTYNLHLQIWSLDPSSASPTLINPPLLQHTFAEPRITIRATDSSKDLPQTVELWQGDQRLSEVTGPGQGQALTQINYGSDEGATAPAFETATAPPREWLPLTQFDSPLYLPCNDGALPFVRVWHFVAGPALTNGIYQPKFDTALPNLDLSFRDRILAPITTTLSFSHTLAPLSLHLPNHPPLDLTQLSTPPPSPNPVLTQAKDSTLPLTLRWHTRRRMAEPIIISLKLLDKDFAVGGERVARLGDRYPNVLWVPTELIEETYPLRLEPSVPPGLYQLELSLLVEDETLPAGFAYLPLTNGNTPLGHNLYPVTIRLLDPAHNTPPAHPFSAQLGHAIELAGYDLNQTPALSAPIPSSPLRPPLFLSLYWQSNTKIPNDYTVFTQLIGPDGQVWGQWDNPPQAGRYPTTAWSESDTVVDRYRLALRDGALPGNYRLLVGMYDPNTGQRLPVTIDGRSQPDNAIELTTLELLP